MTIDVRSARRSCQRTMDGFLDVNIDGAGGVVEHEDARVGEEGAGDGDALALAARQVVTTLADDGVVAVVKSEDEIVSLGRPWRRPRCH